MGGCGHRGLPFAHFTTKTLEFVPDHQFSVESPMLNGHSKGLPQFKAIQDSGGSACITPISSPRSVALFFPCSIRISSRVMIFLTVLSYCLEDEQLSVSAKEYRWLQLWINKKLIGSMFSQLVSVKLVQPFLLSHSGLQTLKKGYFTSLRKGMLLAGRLTIKHLAWSKLLYRTQTP